jgi:ribosomal protein S18 acetylase RimI-like enzyme
MRLGPKCYNCEMQVLPLALASVGRLDEVLGEELGCWRGQLHWDYGPAIDLIRKHVSARSLPGFFLKDGDRYIGYCYHVLSPPLGYLGSVYVQADSATEEAYEALLSESWEALRQNRSIARIESQLFGFNYDVSPLMRVRGCSVLCRHFMTLTVRDLGRKPIDTSAPLGFRVLPWERGYLLPAADVISASYRESVDYEMCYDYQSQEGCVRFLRNLVDNPGCGRFCPETSLIALDSVGRVTGVLITSLIEEGTGMIPQISVRPESQGKGLGSCMMRRYFQAARERRLARVTLSVSEQNRRAHDLYRRLGFCETKVFNAYVWEQDII